MAKKPRPPYARLVVDNDRPDSPINPALVRRSLRRATSGWCRSAGARQTVESRVASSCSRAAEIQDPDQFPASAQKQSRRQPPELRELIQMESCKDIKRYVYSSSNDPFNIDINNAFRLLSMAERPIDRALRLAKAKGMNKSQFAKALDVLPQHITNWIARGLPPEKYEDVADLLRCSVDLLLGRTENIPLWLLDYYCLPSEQQNEITEIVEDRIARFKAKAGTANRHKKAISQ